MQTVLRGAMWASRPTECDADSPKIARIGGWICEGRRVVAPYAGCGADSPGIGLHPGRICRDVEDAVPYEAPS